GSRAWLRTGDGPAVPSATRWSIAAAKREHRAWCATSKGVGEGSTRRERAQEHRKDLGAVYGYRQARPVASVALHGLLRVDQAPEDQADQGDDHVGVPGRIPLGTTGVAQAAPPIGEGAEGILREDRADSADHVHQAKQGPQVPAADLGGASPPGR